VAQSGRIRDHSELRSESVASVATEVRGARIAHVQPRKKD
jgi:hypothetical protein